MALLETISDNGRVLLYTTARRELERVKPSAKMRSKDGAPLYWLPVRGIDFASGREIDITVFTREPLACEPLQPVSYRSADLLQAIAANNEVRGMYELSGVTLGTPMVAAEEVTE